MPDETQLRPIQVVSFYQFFDLALARIAEFQTWIAPKAEPLNLRGLFITGREGINATFSLPREHAAQFKKDLREFFNFSDDVAIFKDSFADKHPFHDLSVKIRPEIVTLARPDLAPHTSPLKENRHLSPAEWQKAINEKDVVLIDTRNSYEYSIGHFKGAVDPETREFREFPEWLENQNLPKDKKVLIYCTGGIRCEKAILEMDEHGFKNVYQLDGGILNYLKEYPNQNFEGECFVFDYRVAVDQELAPTKNYRLCPHCGQPAAEKIKCVQCGVNDIVCESCLEGGLEFKTCSKNCAHHYRMGHKSKRIHQDAFRARQLS